MEVNTLINQMHEIQLLRPADVAARLNISKSYAYRLMQSGALPVVRIGSACRVRPHDLEEYIDRNLHYQVDSV